MEFNKRVGPNNRVGRKMFENKISVQTVDPNKHAGRNLTYFSKIGDKRSTYS